MRLQVKGLFLIILLLHGCGNKGKKNSLIKKTHEINTEKIKYYINYDLFGSFELYINDIKIANDMSDDGSSGYREINQYLFEKKENKIRLKSYVFGDESMYDIENDIVQSIKIEIWMSDENEENIKKLKSFQMPKMKTPKPFYLDLNWEFDAEMPYKLKGFKDAQDLTKINKEELKKKVVSKFNELRELLNNDKSSTFLEEIKWSMEEEFKVNYISQNNIKESYENLIQYFENEQSGNMLPIENYKIKLYGNGKLVTLERIDKDPLFFGKCALLSKFHREREGKNKEFIGVNTLYLMLPEGETKFRIMRYRNDIDW